MTSSIILFFNKYYYSDQIKEDDLDGSVGRIGEMRHVYKILVVNHERKRPFGRHWCRWKCNSEVDPYIWAGKMLVETD
jgi:hypothetical protein